MHKLYYLCMLMVALIVVVSCGHRSELPIPSESLIVVHHPTSECCLDQVPFFEDLAIPWVELTPYWKKSTGGFSALLSAGKNKYGWVHLLTFSDKKQARAVYGTLFGQNPDKVTRFQGKALGFSSENGVGCLLDEWLVISTEAVFVEDLLRAQTQGNVMKAPQTSEEPGCQLQIQSAWLSDWLTPQLQPVGQHPVWQQWLNSQLPAEGSLIVRDSTMVWELREASPREATATPVSTRALDKLLRLLPDPTVLAVARQDAVQDAAATPGWEGGSLHFWTVDGREYAAFSTRQMALLEQWLTQWSRQKGVLHTDRYHMFELIQIASRDWPEGLGSFPVNWDQPCFLFADEAVLWAQNREDLRYWIDQHLTGKGLMQDARFLRQYARHPAQNHFFFARPHRLQTVVRNAFRPSIPVQGWLDAVHEYDLLIGTDRHWQLKYHPIPKTNPDLYWQHELTAPLLWGPQPFWNEAVQEWQIAFQSQDFGLHLLDQRGRKLWQYSLPAPIQSDIHYLSTNEGVDALYFSTLTQLWSLDLQGREREGFPLRLTDTCSGPLQVLKTGPFSEPALFLPLQKGQIVGYSPKGNAMPNWSPAVLDGAVTAFQVGRWENKMRGLVEVGDTLIYLLDEKAQRLAPPVAAASDFPVANQLTGDLPRFVALSAEGRAHIIHPDGRSFPLSFPTPIDDFLLWEYSDSLPAGYVFLQKEQVKIFQYNDKRKLELASSFRLPERATEVFAPRGQNTSPWLGFWCAPSSSLYLTDRNGKVLGGFPFAGERPFQLIDVDGPRQPVVITSLSNKVVAYTMGAG